MIVWLCVKTGASADMSIFPAAASFAIFKKQKLITPDCIAGPNRDLISVILGSLCILSENAVQVEARIDHILSDSSQICGSLLYVDWSVKQLCC